MADYITEYCHFFTATNLAWKNLLLRDKYKEMVIESMRHLAPIAIRVNNHSVEIWTEKVFLQKLKYIHANPVRAGLCNYPLQYKYSSASFYHNGIENWGFLTHIRD